jgi:glycosyltransferase involved in cell wall biosynthesis
MQANKIKVLFFIDSYRIGGMHRQILNLVKHLNKDIFQPIMCTQISTGGLREDFEVTGIKLVDLKWKRKFDISTVFRLITVLKSVKPEIIFMTEAQNFIYYRVARLFWRRPIIQIGSFRALTFWKGHLNVFYKPVDNFFSRWLYKTSDFIVVNSHAMGSHYSKIIKVRSDKPIVTIYNGSDFNFEISKSREIIRKELNLQDDHIMNIMVARLDPWKDFITLFKAIKIVTISEKRAKFFLIGDGMLENSIRKMIVDMDLGEYIFLLKEKQDIYNYINAADICILSTHGEGFSNSILESMAFSKPVIATDIGGNSELIGFFGKSGILVPPKSPDTFANAILYLLNNDAVQKEIGKSARIRIYGLCNIGNYISSYERLFLKAVENKNSLREVVIN